MIAEEHFNNGIESASKGALEQAEHSFLRAIELQPDHPEAYYALGLICKASGRLDEAAILLSRAIELTPAAGEELYFNLGLVLKNSNRLSGAEVCLRQAIELKPDFPEAYNNLGLIFNEMDRLDKAEFCLRQAIDLSPDSSEAHNNLGVIQVKQQLPAEAEHSFRRAIRLDPANPCTHNNLGMVLQDFALYDEAQTCFRRAIELAPSFAEAYYNLGRTFEETASTTEAANCFRQAIDLKPDYLAAHFSLSTLLIITNKIAAAETLLRRIIELSPDSPDAYRRLGRVLKMMHRLDEAETAYLHAIELSPPADSDDPNFGLGILYLLQGQYTKGWGKYDLRRKLYSYADPGIKYWRGEELSGKRILLFCEQGLGDTLQFVRYARKITQLAAETTVWVQPPLERLLVNSLPRCKIYAGPATPPEQYDFACSLHSLPLAFNTSEETIPRDFPYVLPRPDAIAKWCAALDKADGGHQYRVGVIWAGNPLHHNDHNRSITFNLFSQLFDIKQISWVNLQVGNRTDDLSQTDNKIIDFSDNFSDFFETAAVIQNLDLVITVDSAVAHLAAAMGKKTWILLPYAPDWRWQLDREDSPWYPTVRLFRQQEIGDWQPVLSTVKSSLLELLTEQCLYFTY